MFRFLVLALPATSRTTPRTSSSSSSTIKRLPRRTRQKQGRNQKGATLAGSRRRRPDEIAPRLQQRRKGLHLYGRRLLPAARFHVVLHRALNGGKCVRRTAVAMVVIVVVLFRVPPRRRRELGKGGNGVWSVWVVFVVRRQLDVHGTAKGRDLFPVDLSQLGGRRVAFPGSIARLESPRNNGFVVVVVVVVVREERRDVDHWLDVVSPGRRRRRCRCEILVATALLFQRTLALVDSSRRRQDIEQLVHDDGSCGIAKDNIRLSSGFSIAHVR